MCSNGILDKSNHNNVTIIYIGLYKFKCAIGRTRRRRDVDYLCSDGILDKSNHPQLNNQNNVTIALQIQTRHRKKKLSKCKCAIGRRKILKVWSVLLVILTSQTSKLTRRRRRRRRRRKEKETWIICYDILDKSNHNNVTIYSSL